VIEFALDGVAVVTGSGSGIGRAGALAFAEAGARVMVADVDRDGGEETVRLIAEHGGEAAFTEVDVADEPAVAALIAATVERFGQLDYAFNNAGVSQHRTPLVDLDAERWWRTLAVNLSGPFFCMKHEIRAMLGRGGAIVNTSSASAFNSGSPGAAAYTSSKHGLIGLTKSAAVDYAPHGIRINAVCPGAIMTPLIGVSIGDDHERMDAVKKIHPIGRFGEPEEVARTAVWLCSDQASFITAAVLPVDGGAVAHN
jgi:NAD(P)-dependent dehydrogenase (short-subunit alcohol dehydrogenase family)